MKASHTPGPWKVVQTRDVQDVYFNVREDIPDLPGKQIAQVNQHVGRTYRGTQVAEANARLIAAAPDLLKALQEICREAVQAEYDDGPVMAELPWGFINIALSAIARATS